MSIESIDIEPIWTDPDDDASVPTGRAPDALCRLIGETSYPKPGSSASNSSTLHWQIIACPFCGKEHLHGAGNNPEDARQIYLGHRVTHCTDIAHFFVHHEGYYLVEAEPGAEPVPHKQSKRKRA